MPLSSTSMAGSDGNDAGNERAEHQSPYLARLRQYFAVDHLNSTRVVVSDDDGLVSVEEVDYYPFGGFLTGGPQPSTTHPLTGHERDTAEIASNLDHVQVRE